jgi:uncharacterized protein YbjT (DUF2867 family)
MILIVGASGRLGKAIARQALGAGKAVRASSREPEERLGDIKAAGAEVIAADLRDPASLQRACQGAQAVVASAHGAVDGWGNHSKLVDDKGHRDLVNAAKAAGVEHFIYISAMDAAPDHPAPWIRFKAGVEEYLAKSGIDYTIIRPTAFMETYAHLLLGQALIEKGKVSVFGEGNSPRNFVSVEDVARFVIIALEDPRAKGDIIEVGGPDNPTTNEVAQMYAERIDGEVKIGNMPRAMLKVMSTLMKPFQPGMSQIMMYAYLEDIHGSPFDMGPTLAKYPIELTPIEQFVDKQFM